MIRTMFIPTGMYESISKLGEVNANEICGIITGTNVKNKIMYGENMYQIENISATMPEVDYIMQPQQVYDILKQTSFIDKESPEDFVAIFHSHPRSIGVPSSIDLDRAEYNVVYLIYGAADRLIRGWAYNKKENKFEQVQVIKT